MVKTIIFDFDGTLADSFPLVLKVQQKVARKFGYKVIFYDPGLREKRFVDILKEEGELRSNLSLLRFLSRFQRAFDEVVEEIRLFSGFQELLHELNVVRGFELGLLSTNISHHSLEHIEHVLAKESVLQYFSFLRHASVFVGKKYALRGILKERNLSPKDVLYVGDEVDDFFSCRGVGISFVGVGWGVHSKAFLGRSGVKKVILKREDLLKILK